MSETKIEGGQLGRNIVTQKLFRTVLFRLWSLRLRMLTHRSGCLIVAMRSSFYNVWLHVGMPDVDWSRSVKFECRVKRFL